MVGYFAPETTFPHKTDFFPYNNNGFSRVFPLVAGWGVCNKQRYVEFHNWVKPIDGDDYYLLDYSVYYAHNAFRTTVEHIFPPTIGGSG